MCELCYNDHEQTTVHLNCWYCQTQTLASALVPVREGLIIYDLCPGCFEELYDLDRQQDEQMGTER